MTIVEKTASEEDRGYPQEWGLCVRVLKDQVPDTIRLYENVFTNEIAAVCESTPDYDLMKRFNVNVWITSNELH